MSRKFNLPSEDMVKQIQTINLKKKTELTVNWGVNAYNEWLDHRLYTFQYDYGIYNADL